MTAQQAIGSYLRAARETQKLTQEQVAAMTRGTPWRLSRAAISAIERGQNFPGMEAMLALSNVLFVDPKQLVERARLSAVVPVDLTGLTYEELERSATQYFWDGDFRKALSVLDAMLEMTALEAEEESDETTSRVVSLEVRRATALKRAGALLSAIATAERAISLSVSFPKLQAEAYIVLADLQVQRGHLPLASDAAQRAVSLANEADPKTRGWAWIVMGRVHYLAKEFEQARHDFLEARKFAREAGDTRHMTHVEGDIGMCWLELKQVEEARRWIRRAVELAQRHAQPTLEASWLVELGKIALREGVHEEAESYAGAALRIAKPREQHLTIFRAEWLRHLVVRATDPSSTDRHRLAYLRKLYQQLDQHEGIEEVQEFRKTALRRLEAESGGLS
jgi:tetratricopeptide (TPR) repeat protein